MSGRHRAQASNRPRLSSPEDGLDLPRGADAETLWRLGERAEEAFDYEGARGLYREAARAAPTRRIGHFVTGYAAFLVERYGQFNEVAAWLDDDDFEPLAISNTEEARLPALVALAAAEVGHARSPDLDRALANHLGEPGALTRTARRLNDAGAQDEALALLSRFGDRLGALSEAGRLLEQLRARTDAACADALKPVEAALEARDAAAARAALEACRAQWQEQAIYRSTEARVAAAERLAGAEALRRQIEAALDDDDLTSARQAALELVRLEPDNPADKNTLNWIEQRQEDKRQAELLARIDGEADEASAVDLLSTLYARHGAKVEVGERWARAWALVCEAAGHEGPLGGQGAELAAVLALETTMEAGDPAAIADRLSAIVSRWQGLRIVRQARGVLKAADQASRDQQESALIAEVEGLLDQDDLSAASARLQQHGSTADQRGTALRALYKRVEERQLAGERKQARLRELDERLSGGRLFGARRLLDRMATEGEVGGEALDDLRVRLKARWSEEMQAMAVPPVGLQVSEEPFAVGVANGRLLIVQQRLWLTINLQTRGLQPFQLPESCEIASRPGARIAEVDGKAVLVGFSKGRLIRIEQSPGQPPEVIEGARLSRLLRGDDRISGTAIEPDAATWRLLHYSSQRPGAPATISEIDAATMSLMGADRHRPALASLRGIRHRPDSYVVATTADARARRGWALALYDRGDRGRPGVHMSQQELVEPVARFTGAIAWPEADRLYASYSVYDVFNPDEVHATSSLLVLRGSKLIFASADLRRRFAPTAPLIVDHPWTLDTHSGRLWFAALPRATEEARDAMVLGVDAERLRADRPVKLEGIERILAIEPWADGAVLLGRLHSGKLAMALARMEAGGDLALTIDGLPV